MKKVLLVTAVAFVTFTSCKKQYTCTCTSTTTLYINSRATVGAPATSSVQYDDKMNMGDAKSKCESTNSTTMTGDTQNGGKVVVSDCKIDG